MNDLWRVVDADHDLIWGLLNRLTGGPAAREGTPREHRRTAKLLVAVESAHEAAEELILWPRVRRCPGGDQLVEQARHQEGEAKRALNELEHISAGNQEFDECVQSLAGMAREHIAYEQNQIWVRLDEQLRGDEPGLLAAEWLAARRTGPTRPHPHVPALPGILGSVGLLVAKADRTRDRLTGRRVPEPEKWGRTSGSSAPTSARPHVAGEGE
ncbi:MAG TPA: hemerythrin domain-containing protein [Acidimicrobiales bacterium]|jgi:hypothetical protein